MERSLLKNNNGNAGARLLVILFALGIVILGWQPLRHGKGTMFESISDVASKFTESISRARARRGEELKVEVPAVKLDKEEHLDKTTDDDRKKLNSLIDDL